jgi:hypothetical protein
MATRLSSDGTVLQGGIGLSIRLHSSAQCGIIVSRCPMPSQSALSSYRHCCGALEPEVWKCGTRAHGGCLWRHWLESTEVLAACISQLEGSRVPITVSEHAG